MKRCPITYEPANNQYSDRGLKLLSARLTELTEIEFSAKEQRHEAAKRATKMSVQGVQPKLSAILNIKESKFDIVDVRGIFIIKPQHLIYPNLPENEDLTMKMARVCGIETPLHGMIFSKDETLSYFIKRFDRLGRNQRLPLEDFAQLAEESRSTKYDYSIEKLIKLIDIHCTFPVLEKNKFFKRFIFNYLVGNEDMHLKNYSLITRNNKVELSPAYDFLNTSIALGEEVEESALSLKGVRANLNREMVIDYLGNEKLELAEKAIQNTIDDIRKSIPVWLNLIDISFLSPELKKQYKFLLNSRIEILKI